MKTMISSSLLGVFAAVSLAFTSWSMAEDDLISLKQSGCGAISQGLSNELYQFRKQATNKIVADIARLSQEAAESKADLRKQNEIMKKISAEVALFQSLDQEEAKLEARLRADNKEDLQRFCE